MASKGPSASASPENSSAGGPSGSSNGAGESGGQDSTFECNICLDTAKDAVISLCGHLFCLLHPPHPSMFLLMKAFFFLSLFLFLVDDWLLWGLGSWPCLHQWLETRPNRQVCPVCKAGISRDKVIPLYGRGSTGQQDPRNQKPQEAGGSGFSGCGTYLSQLQAPTAASDAFCIFCPKKINPPNGFQGFGFGDGGFQMSFGIGAFPFGIFATAFNINDGRPPPAVPGTPQYVDEQFLSRLFLFVALVIMFWLLIA
ncbi:hypothetical protein MC885_015819 [Smutsia gigantea]|nr:hypothetical protein MC885_015819 [Smutsia gigantea]